MAQLPALLLRPSSAESRYRQNRKRASTSWPDFDELRAAESFQAGGVQRYNANDFAMDTVAAAVQRMDMSDRPRSTRLQKAVPSLATGLTNETTYRGSGVSEGPAASQVPQQRTHRTAATRYSADSTTFRASTLLPSSCQSFPRKRQKLNYTQTIHALQAAHPIATESSDTHVFDLSEHGTADYAVERSTYAASAGRSRDATRRNQVYPKASASFRGDEQYPGVIEKLQPLPSRTPSSSQSGHREDSVSSASQKNSPRRLKDSTPASGKRRQTIQLSTRPAMLFGELWDDKVDMREQSRSRPRLATTYAQESTSQDRYGLVQEKLWQTPFWLCVACLVIEVPQRHREQTADQIVAKLMAKYPDEHVLARVSRHELKKDLTCTSGLYKPEDSITELAKGWARNPPSVDGPRCDPEIRCLDLSKKHPVMEYSWRIFCRDVFRGLADDYNGKNPQPNFLVPEWKNITLRSTNREGLNDLHKFLEWMWRREGQVWNHSTGVTHPIMLPDARNQQLAVEMLEYTPLPAISEARERPLRPNNHAPPRTTGSSQEFDIIETSNVDHVTQIGQAATTAQAFDTASAADIREWQDEGDMDMPQSDQVVSQEISPTTAVAHERVPLVSSSQQRSPFHEEDPTESTKSTRTSNSLVDRPYSIVPVSAQLEDFSLPWQNSRSIATQTDASAESSTEEAYNTHLLEETIEYSVLECPAPASSGADNIAIASHEPSAMLNYTPLHYESDIWTKEASYRSASMPKTHGSTLTLSPTLSLSSRADYVPEISLNCTTPLINQAEIAQSGIRKASETCEDNPPNDQQCLPGDSVDVSSPAREEPRAATKRRSAHSEEHIMDFTENDELLHVSEELDEPDGDITHSSEQHIGIYGNDTTPPPAALEDQDEIIRTNALLHTATSERADRIVGRSTLQLAAAQDDTDEIVCKSTRLPAATHKRANEVKGKKTLQPSLSQNDHDDPVHERTLLPSQDRPDTVVCEYKSHSHATQDSVDEHILEDALSCSVAQDYTSKIVRDETWPPRASEADPDGIVCKARPRPLTSRDHTDGIITRPVSLPLIVETDPDTIVVLPRAKKRPRPPSDDGYGTGDEIAVMPKGTALGLKHLKPVREAHGALQRPEHSGRTKNSPKPKHTRPSEEHRSARANKRSKKRLKTTTSQAPKWSGAETTQKDDVGLKINVDMKQHSNPVRRNYKYIILELAS